MVADLSVHAFDLIVPGGQLSLPVSLLAQPLPFCKHPSQQPLPNHDLTLHHTPTTTEVSMSTNLKLPDHVVSTAAVTQLLQFSIAATIQGATQNHAH